MKAFKVASVPQVSSSSWASGCVWMRWIYFVFLPAEGKQNKTFHPIARSMEPTIIEHPPCTSLVAFGSCPSFKSNNFHIFCLIPDVLFSPSESWPQGKVRRPGADDVFPFHLVNKKIQCICFCDSHSVVQSDKIGCWRAFGNCITGVPCSAWHL